MNEIKKKRLYTTGDNSAEWNVINLLLAFNTETSSDVYEVATSHADIRILMMHIGNMYLQGNI